MASPTNNVSPFTVGLIVVTDPFLYNGSKSKSVAADWLRSKLV